MTTPVSRRPRRRRLLSCLPVLLLVLPLAGCGTVKGLMIRTVMDKARLPEAQVERDLAYGPHERNRLDLFRPAAGGWPLLVFVHGGSWNAGDKALEVGSFEPYQNIGRYYASRGVGVALLNYRLQPAVDWRGQVEDVAVAVGWLADHLAERGGDPRRIFLSGHSAGAQLVSYVAAAPWLAEHRGQAKICGVIAVSGAGFDLADQETYRLGADPKFYERTFKGGQADGVWQEEASASTYLRPDLPPFLLYYGAKEWPSLRHQNELFARQLRRAGASVELRRMPKLSHSRMALAISDEKRPMTERILSFLGGCPE
jgi:acetyl esterase/lipase